MDTHAAYRVVEYNSVDGHKVFKVIFIGREVAVPGDDVKRRMSLQDRCVDRQISDAKQTEKQTQIYALLTKTLTITLSIRTYYADLNSVSTTLL